MGRTIYIEKKRDYIKLTREKKKKSNKNQHPICYHMAITVAKLKGRKQLLLRESKRDIDNTK